MPITALRPQYYLEIIYNNVPDAIRFSSHLHRAAAVRLGDKYMLMATLYTLYTYYTI